MFIQARRLVIAMSLLAALRPVVHAQSNTPTLKQATPTNSSAQVSYSPVNGALSYNVYWSTSPNVTPQNAKGHKDKNLGTLVTAAPLVNGPLDYIVVTAVTASGESDVSNEVSVNPASTSSPAQAQEGAKDDAATAPASAPEPATAPAPAATGTTTTEKQADPNDGCGNGDHYIDCVLEYSLLGGIEQSDLSAQSSITQGFYDLFMNEPFSKGGSIWFRSRYLGTPSSSSSQNIVAAATNPTGTLTAANLPQSVAAVDYVIGYQFHHGLDLARKDAKGNGANKVTLNPIIGAGATTPLSATTTVSGFAVPNYGTNECNQLQQRFTLKYGYNPALPASGPYDAAGDMGCVVQPNLASTTAKPLPGTKITDIAFSNEDRSSFLLKWGAGVRIIDREKADPAKEATWCDIGPGCSKLRADFTVGQDEDITGGYLRHFVFKADAVIPILSTGFYFFAASANRLERDTTLSPLILTPVTIMNSGSSTCTASASTACIPSSSVFVLPFKQQNRDFYRIGIGIDAMKILKIFKAAS
jgi:hypothetical protein